MANVTNLTSVTGFFVRVGGKELPAAYNWNNNFGFNPVYDSSNPGIITELGEPIFKHSLMDVINNFDAPYTYTHDDEITTNKAISDLLILETSNNEQAGLININSGFWSTVIKLLELININESQWKQEALNSTGTGSYTCRGDEILSNNEPMYGGLTFDSIGGANGIYVSRSLSISVSSKETIKDRIRRAQFELKYLPELTSESSGGIDTANEASIISFDIYFDPDLFISEGAISNHAIYTYEDLDDVTDEIDDSNDKMLYEIEGLSNQRSTEFDVAIMRKLFALAKTGKYKRIIRYADGNSEGQGYTIHVRGGNVVHERDDIGNIIRSYIDGGTMVTKVFYILSSLDEGDTITDETKLNYIREYVRSKFTTGTNDETSLIEMNLRYPNLFDDTVVEIYPMSDNQTESGITKHPMGRQSFNNAFSRAGYTMGTISFEVFHIGSPSDLQNPYIYPLIAFEPAYASGNPISSRMPRYVPRYGSSVDETSVGINTIRFQYLVILALKILYEGITENQAIAAVQDIAIKEEDNPIEQPIYGADLSFKYVPSQIDETTHRNTREYVEFRLASVKYKVYYV